MQNHTFANISSFSKQNNLTYWQFIFHENSQKNRKNLKATVTNFGYLLLSWHENSMCAKSNIKRANIRKYFEIIEAQNNQFRVEENTTVDFFSALLFLLQIDYFYCHSYILAKYQAAVTWRCPPTSNQIWTKCTNYMSK